MNKNDIIDIEIDNISEDGSGIGRHNGMVVFCRGMLPGERGSVRIIKVTKSYAIGKMLSLSLPSPHRIDPPLCNYFTKGCGGCTFSHFDMESQLEYKRQRVIDCLTRIGGLDEAEMRSMVRPVIAADTAFGYRNKSIYPFAPASDGSKRVVCGFYAYNSHRVVPLGDDPCGLENEMSRDVRNFTMRFAAENKLTAYDENSGRGLLRALMVRTNNIEPKEAMTVLIVNERAGKNGLAPVLQKYASELTEALPFVASVWICLNDRKTNVVLDGKLCLAAGKPTIHDTIDTFEGAPGFDISPLSFYQVNPAQTKRLYGSVYDFLKKAMAREDDAHQAKLIYDIYCGIGTIGIYLLARMRAEMHMEEELPFLVGVEVVPSAVDDAHKNAAANGVNAEFYCGDASDVTPKVIEKHGRPSVIILDPPRKGCDASLLETVISTNADNILYVSCNPATLARDLKILCASGYTCAGIQLVDMFPQSGHVETVVLLSH